MSRRGMLAKRCTSCGRRVRDKRCQHCGSDSYTWGFTVDVGAMGGKRRQLSRSGFRTKREASMALAEVQTSVAKGIYVEPSRQTFEEFLRDWLPAIKATVRASTWESYKRNIRVHVVPRLGPIRLQQLSAADLNAFYDYLLTEGRRHGGGLSPRTVRYIHTILRRALKDATRWNRLARNPADQADPPRVSVSNAKEMRTWSGSELRQFLDHVNQDRLAAAWTLMAMTGMRRGEVLGLRWEDVDLGARRLSVRRSLISVAYRVEVSEPKTRRGKRSIALDSTTVNALRDHRKRQLEERMMWGSAWQDIGLVFTREDGSPIHPEAFSKSFDRHVRDAGLPRIRLHDVRHSYATLALAAGEAAKVVSERLGHATVAITLDTYSHVIPEMQEAAAERVAKLVFGE